MHLHRGIFCSFSRPRAQGKPQLKVKLRILKILKLYKYPPHPRHGSLKCKYKKEIDKNTY